LVKALLGGFGAAVDEEVETVEGTGALRALWIAFDGIWLWFHGAGDLGGERWLNVRG